MNKFQSTTSSLALDTVVRLGRMFRSGWLMVGACLVTVLVFEVSLRGVFWTKDTLIDDPSVNPVALADGYDGATWPVQYFEEEIASRQLQWRPYIYWRRQSFTGEHVQVDRNGIRHTWQPVTPVLEEPPLRIFVFGGSTVWGSGSRDDQTIPSWIARLATNAQLHVEVTNFGETGYVSTQELLLLYLQLRAGNVPNLVIFYDGVNDTFSAFQNREAGIPQNETNRRAEFNITKNGRGLLDAYWRHLRQHPMGLNRLADALRRRLPTPATPSTERKATHDLPLSADLADRVVLAYQSNIDLVDQLATRYGFETLYFWQPAIWTKPHLTPYETKRRDGMSRSLESFLLTTYEMVTQADGLAHNTHFHNLSRVFEKTTDPVYIDFCHLTETGNQRIAEAMLPHIVKTLRNTDAE